MTNDVILNKIQVIERCLNRINEVYENNPANLSDYTKQDSIVLNIQRSCEASIDLSMHIVSVKKLGIPQNSKDAFDLLISNSIIPAELGKNLKAMVGFRNIAVHDYQEINLNIIQKIITNHLADLLEFTSLLLQNY